MRQMFEKPRCKCPRCVSRRRIRYLTVSGVCAAITVGYFAFALAERRQSVPDLLFENAGGSADLRSSNLASVPAGNSAPIAESPDPQTKERQTAPLVEPGNDNPENAPQPDGVNIATVAPEPASEPAVSELSFRALVVTSRDKDVAMTYDSDPYALLPPWLIGNIYEMPQSWRVASANAGESVTQNREQATDEPVAATCETSPVAISEPKGNEIPDPVGEKGLELPPALREAIILAEQLSPGQAPYTPGTQALTASPTHENNDENNTPPVSVTSALAEKSESHPVSEGSAASLFATASVPAEKTESKPASADVTAAEPIAASVPAEKSESSPESDRTVAQVAAGSVPAEQRESSSASKDHSGAEVAASVPEENSNRSADVAMVSSPRLSGSLSQQTKQTDPVSRNKLALAGKKAPSQEKREPSGYISVQSKFESPRAATDRIGSIKRPNHPPKKEDYPAEPQDSSPQIQNYPPEKPQDYASKHRDSSSKPGNESGDLQRFASDFVRTNQTGSLADQHRFYADSVRYYGEGDLSWAGVAAATQRYQRQEDRRYGAAAPAVVKGPVNGGFYVVDQPVRSKRGRSVLRLRVVPTGRSGWKITSIEEIGQ
jgi:hypothetical protein